MEGHTMSYTHATVVYTRETVLWKKLKVHAEKRSEADDWEATSETENMAVAIKVQKGVGMREGGFSFKARDKHYSRKTITMKKAQ